MWDSKEVGGLITLTFIMGLVGGLVLGMVLKDMSWRQTLVKNNSYHYVVDETSGYVYFRPTN